MRPKRRAHHPPPEPQEDENLKLAAEVADRAGVECPVSDAETPIHDRNQPDSSGYREALDEIAALVALRSLAVQPDSSPPPSDDDSNLGRWGPFVLQERLGAGASGEVYKAKDTHLGHLVALKLFHQLRLPSVDLDSLLLEGRQHALVRHTNVAVIHGADEYEGRIGIWMEYIDGHTLHGLVERDGSFGASEAVNVGVELCAALAAVHQRKLTHGDIKAQNIMREKGGRIVLMDFSSSRPLHVDDDAPSVAGTPIYMAPELFEGRPADFGSDLYALGVLLFYLVTGRHPNEAENVRELKEAVRRKQPLLLEDLRPDIPRRFGEAIRKATAHSPEDRFRSAGEFQRALRAAQVGESDDRSVGKPTDRDAPVDVPTSLLSVSLTLLAAVTAVGFLTTLCFHQSLSIPSSFVTDGVVDYFLWGARALIPLVVYLALRGLAAGLAIGSALLLWKLAAPRSWRQKFTTARESLMARVQYVPGPAVVAFSLLLGAVAVLGVNLLHYEVSDTMIAMFQALPDAGSVDLSPLFPSYRYLRTFAFGKVIAALLVLWLGTRYVLTHIGDRRQVAFLDLGTASIVLVACLTLTAPYRLVWHAKFEPLHYDCRPAFLLAESDGSALLYSLDSFRSWQTPIDDIRITRGKEREVKNMFDEWTLSRPKECNSEKASVHLTTNDREEFL